MAVALRPRTGQAELSTSDARLVELPAFELDEMTVSDLQSGMNSGKFTSRLLVEKYSARIRSMDTQGPALRAVIEMNPDALAIADAMDSERRAGKVRGPMHGIPVLIKDNIATADKMETTAGSLMLVGAKVPRDAFIVTRLRNAGAVILGKTNLSEWANFRSTHSSSGWTGRYGQTKNPYALDRSPSGSSSGSGTAAAANFCAVTIGTETDGSITAPAAAASLVGLKPTVGLVSRSGIIPISASQDTAGPMTRTVVDAALLLTAIAGSDSRDATTREANAHTMDFTRNLAAGIRGMRIGVPREKLFGYNVKTDALANAAINVLRGLGAVIVDPANIPTAGKVDDDEYEVLLYEFKDGLHNHFAEVDSPIKSLADMIAYNDAHAREELPYFGQEIFLKAEKKGSLKSREYLKALARSQRMARAEGIDATMKKYKLDAFIAPTMAPPPLIDLVSGDPGFPGGATTLPAVSGYPHVTVPGGYIFGVPIGISFFAEKWSDSKLLRIAYAFEQATHHRKPPRFLPTAEV
ncbi:MAG: amidase [Gemmatimonadaceae bacterium]|nr:amidase [Gemmatimonadaceae bacterium]